MSKEFSRTFRVRWSETNANGQVGFAGFLRYLMETAWDWGATGGLSIAENEALGIAWIIRENDIEIFRPLLVNDVFEFRIWLINWRRVRGTRGFELRLCDSNEIVAQGVQQVATLDMNTLRPMRVSEVLLGKFLIENPRIIEHQKFPKYHIQPDPAFVTHRDVEWRDLDVLGHVNNATYAEFAEEAAAQALASLGWSLAKFKAQGLAVVNRRFHIQYQGPALWAESLDVEVNLVALNPTAGTWFINIERAVDKQAIVKCVVEWGVADPITGEERTLPEELLQVLEKTAVS